MNGFSSPWGIVYAGLGRTTDAGAQRGKGRQAEGRSGRCPLHLQDREAAARVLAQAGLADEALVHLETVLANNTPVSVHTLALDPLLDPIRDHPGFQALLERYAMEVE